MKVQSKGRDASPTKKSRRDRNTPRETSGHESKDQETLETRPLGEIFSTAEKKTIAVRSTLNVLIAPQEADRHNLYRCGKKLGGLTAYSFELSSEPDEEIAMDHRQSKNIGH